MEWLEPRYLEIEAVGTKDFLCVEGWDTRETDTGRMRSTLAEYYWFTEPFVRVELLAKLATLQLLGENPDRLYRWIRGTNGE